MPTTVRDASLTTYRRRQLAYYSWRNDHKLHPSVQKEQSAGNGFKASGPSGFVPLEAYVGAQLAGQSSTPITTPCGCNSGVTLAGFSKTTGGDIPNFG